ncbi:MAG: ATPase, T2SS/T4P/T4SS family [Candidatus Omnitrophica bacterium]|nr:ATPase, T2SS/T4P/T4SS family [Candidatus Omnitrophota bacterium]MDD5477075.1 ATPase, T2SS/T4P/T4SS family [Candidatus Omnitrophota bacterium]
MPKKIDTILSEGLIERGLISREALEPLFKEIEKSGESLQQVLVKRQASLEKDILDVFAEKLKFTCLINLKEVSIDKSIFDKVPLKIASYYKFVPVSLKDRLLTIAVSSPLDIKIQDEIRTHLGFDIETVLSCHGDILDSLKKYYGFAADTMKEISRGSEVKGLFQEPAQEKVEDIEKLAGDASVIRLVNQVILEGYKKRATDIHIEPHREGVNLRYRIDGLLYETKVAAEIKNFLNAIISRIKIMSNLNIVERRLPQDGRAIVKVGEQMLDLRISTMPTPFGESVVIRILPTKMLFSLEKLGLPKKDLQIFESLILKPHGIIFITGPTGSGKTTTLYTCLSRINTKERKIITIEDPIEYEMPNITQIQVMPEIGLDFARGLRSILRHDPDVIMLGEVRDLETAQIAIRVALTGHMVFSTLHTNDAVSGINRLIDIGVEPYLLASSVEAFIAQRLIRLICPDCKYEDKATPAQLKEMIAKDLGLESKDAVKIFRGKGCPSCNFTGFFGRTAIYEILIMDGGIKDLILKKATSSQITKVALAKGMRTLRQDGWQKTVAGLTTPEEVMKTTSAQEQLNDLESKTQVFLGGFTPESAHSPKENGKRAYQRLNSKVNLRYRVLKSQDELARRGFTPEELSVTSNISAGGLLFFSDEILAIGSILELILELPGGGEDPIECLARVTRVEEMDRERKYNIAVCFLDITGAQRGRLNKFVEQELS